MLRSWASGQKAKLTGLSSGLKAEGEEDALAQAMAAAMHIMNDDLDAAEQGLQGGASTFHKLGQGLIAFLKAALGFEKEIMKEAQERLALAETQAIKEQRTAQKDPEAFRSKIYEPGMEYALTHAECLLMGAVIGVLNESLTEALKGFYNLRKAYMALSSIADAEERYLQRRPGSRASLQQPAPQFSASATSTEPNSISGSTIDLPSTRPQEGNAQEGNAHGKTLTNDAPSIKLTNGSDGDGDEDDGDAFEDAAESVEEAVTPLEYQGKTEVQGIVKDLSHLHVSNSEPNLASDKPSAIPGIGSASSLTDLKTQQEPQQPASPHTMRSSTAFSGRENGLSTSKSAHFQHPIDIYIHSGVNLCFGMLLMMLSMIPPAFGRLLSIIGFRGDRERGLRMLWKASQFPNINGAMAGLVILLFYNGLIGFCDIIPDSTTDSLDGPVENVDGYPVHRLEALLANLRKHFPKSGLWRFEEARMLGAKQRSDEAIVILSQKLDSPLKQVNALAIFERALQSMFSHRFQLCADSFVECIKLNNWSHALYFYLAGCAHVEIYRIAIREEDPTKAKQAAENAQKYFDQVADSAGRRKFMGKQVPFEAFCIRKLSKWQEHAKEWRIPMIDAIGASPIEEMCFQWNGYKKMNPATLQISLQSLQWSEDHDTNWSRHGLDEKAILSLLRAVTHRSLKNFDEAQSILKNEVLCHDRSLITGGLKDDWTLPVAHYEMAVNQWQTRTEIGTPGESNTHNRKHVKEALEWVEKIKHWGSFSLDGRVGMRVTAAEGTLRKWLAKHDR